MASADIHARWKTAARRAGAVAEAEDFAARVARVNHLPGLIKLLTKLELPPALHAPAQAALADFTPRGMDDFQMVYGLVGILARDGSADAARVLRTFAKRADARAKSETVVDPAESIGRVLRQLGKGPHIKAVAGDLAEI